RLWAAGSSTLRARLSPRGNGAVAIELADATGLPVATIDSLVLRPISTKILGRVATAEPLFAVRWAATPLPADAAAPLRRSTIGPVGAWNAVPDAEAYADVPALIAALDAGADVPEVLVASATTGADDRPARSEPSGLDAPGIVRAATHEALGLLQAWLAE